MDESFIIPPEDDRNDILRKAHEFGHFGAEAMIQRIRKDKGMDWPKIREEALEITKQCPTCQKFTIHLDQCTAIPQETVCYILTLSCFS